MNVVRFVNHFPERHEILYGLHPTFYLLSREQVRLGLNVHVVCRARRRQKRFEEIEGIRVHRVMNPYNFGLLHKLMRLRYRTGVDVVHAHATSGYSYALLKKFLFDKWAKISIAHVHGTTRGILYAWNKVPHVSVVRGTRRQRARTLMSIMRETVVWKNADALIVNSKFLGEDVINLYGIPRRKIEIVYNGFDSETFYPRRFREKTLESLGLDRKSHLILYLGGFRPVKGPLYVIKAFEKIAERNKDIKLLFVGGRSPLDRKNKKAFIPLMRKLREKDAILLTDNIPHFSLPEIYSAADALVLPSIYDSFPKVALEAMACGTPVIASAMGGMLELIRHGQTGILVEPADPDKLAEAITTIVADPDLRKRLGSNAKESVSENFTWQRVAKQTRKLYERLLGAS